MVRYMDIEGHIYHCSTRRACTHVARVARVRGPHGLVPAHARTPRHAL